MTILIYLPIGFLYLILQSSLSTFLLPRFFYVDAILVIVFFIAQRSGGWSDVMAAFLLGYIHDLFSTFPLGMTSISLLIIFLLVYYVARVMEFRNPYTIISGAAVLEGTHLFLLFVLQYLFQGLSSVPLKTVMVRVLLTALFALPAFYLFRILEERVRG